MMSHPAFFYGTLLVPEVLSRVLKAKDASHLQFQPALLPGHSRHVVRDEDYPAVIPVSEARELLGRELSEDEATVRGTLVYGLGPSDMRLLDHFEGDEYSLRSVEVIPLTDELRSLKDQPDVFSESLKVSAEAKKVSARIYMWTAGAGRLEPTVWDFHAFLIEKAHLWSSPNPHTEASHPDMTAAASSLPVFGHALIPEFSFRPGYINLNHGSYGSVPKRVMEYCRKLSDECESSPDIFIRRTYLPLLTEVRTSIASMIKADVDDVVMVPNATTGVNTITLNLDWKAGDIIVAYSTSYGAILQSLRYTCDANPGVKLVVIPLTFPLPHAEIVRQTEDVFRKYNAHGGDAEESGRVRMVVVDGIASNPGMIFPWRDIAKKAREYNVLSLVDGAHLIGQLPIDLSDDTVCDFLVTNFHKWGMSHRASALLWVPKRNQPLIRTSIPTSFDYESTQYPGTGRGAWAFARQYSWTGTIDYVPFLSVKAAIDFRTWLGGEERITKYCHELALEGGKVAQKIFGPNSRIMENEDMEKDGELTANMVNVSLPPCPAPSTPEEALAMGRFFENSLFDNNAFAAVYRHGDEVWVRMSAQVWNELSDFEYVANLLVKCVEKLGDGSWKKQ